MVVVSWCFGLSEYFKCTFLDHLTTLDQLPNTGWFVGSSLFWTNCIIISLKAYVRFCTVGLFCITELQIKGSLDITLALAWLISKHLALRRDTSFQNTLIVVGDKVSLLRCLLCPKNG